MKILPALLCVFLIGCGTGQSDQDNAPIAFDSTADEFDFSNHVALDGPFSQLKETIDQHPSLMLKVNVADEPSHTLYIGQIDNAKQLDQLHLYLPSTIKAIDFELYNALGFSHSGRISF